MQSVIAPIESQARPTKCGESWRRTFDSHDLVSTQLNGGHRLLLERIGIFELALRLTVIAGGLEYRSPRASVDGG
jgi:hypothetical protein